jgi:hypothetical protein
MSPKIFSRLVGALACMAAVVTGLDAEAGSRHRRCCAPSYCTTSCCSPCTTVSATPVCNTCYDTCGCPTAYERTCSTWRDACGLCHTSCGWTTTVSTPVVISECCVATVTTAPATQTAATAGSTRVRPVSTVSR